MTATRTAGTAVWVGKYEPGTPEWHAARRSALGGSEIAAVVGLAPKGWSSAFALWHYKAGMLAPDESDSFKMTLGRVLEQAVCELYLQRNPGHHLQRTGMWANADRPWQVAEPDRFKTPAPRSHKPYSLVEAKTADSGDAWQWGPDGGDQDDVPPYYACQVLWYLDTFGFTEGTLAVLIGAREYREYTIRHSTTDATWLRDEAEKFLATVRDGQPPAIDGAEATYQAVRELHPEIDGTNVDIPYHVAQGLATARAAAAAAAEEERRWKGEVGHHMGTARAAWCNGVQIATRKSRGGGTPWVEAARGLPAQIPTEQPNVTEGSAA